MLQLRCAIGEVSQLTRFCTTEKSSYRIILVLKGAAATCEMNLMKTFKYGGRKTPPSREELSQLVVSMKFKIYTAFLGAGMAQLFRAFAFRQCGLGSIPAQCHMWVSSLLKDQHYSNSNSACI